MAAMIATALAWVCGNRRALTVAKWGAIALTVLLFLLSIRRAGERTGRIAESLEAMEKANDVQRRMLDAASRHPRDRGELAARRALLICGCSRFPALRDSGVAFLAIDMPEANDFTARKMALGAERSNHQRADDLVDVGMLACLHASRTGYP